MAGKMEEEVLVVQRAALLGNEVFTGLRPPDPVYVQRIRQHGLYRRRAEVEEDPRFKQIIPYGVVRRGDEVFVFQRLGGGGEARLHHLYSLGVGGHINRADVGEEDPLEVGMERELEEELEFLGPREVRWIGVLNDDRNPVSAVHFGLVYEVHTSGEVRVREKEVLRGGFVPVKDVPSYYERMETWSQLVVEGLGWKQR